VTDTAIIIEVESPLGDNSEDAVRSLDQVIRWIRGHQSPFEAYVEKLKMVSSQGNDGRSGLGLVRIAYEGQSILDFYVNERNMLAVSAVYKL
jgi:hypothetical protein